MPAIPRIGEDISLGEWRWIKATNVLHKIDEKITEVWCDDGFETEDELIQVFLDAEKEWRVDAGDDAENFAKAVEEYQKKNRS